jgi:hypothetical protein
VCPPGHGPVNEPDDEHRAHPDQDKLRYQVLKLPGFAGSAQNPVDVTGELRCIERRLSPAEVDALIADYAGSAAL